MKTAEKILKEKLDELSQHNGSYPSFKHSDPDLTDAILEAMEEYKDQFLANLPTTEEIEKAAFFGVSNNKKRGAFMAGARYVIDKIKNSSDEERKV